MGPSEELKLILTGDPTGANTAVSSVAKSVNDLAGAAGVGNQSFLNLAAGMATGTLAADAIGAAFGEVTAFLKGSLEEWSKQELAVRRVETAMRAQGISSKALIEGNLALGEAFAKTTVYADDELQAMEALLIQVGNVGPQQMHAALRASTDLASGLGIDLRTATMLVAKAFEGNTDALKRYGIVVDETTLKAEGVSAVLDAIQAKFGGQAAAELDTYSGKVKQAGKAWGEFKETVGQALAPIVGAALSGVTATIQRFLDDLHGMAPPGLSGDQPDRVPVDPAKRGQTTAMTVRAFEELVKAQKEVVITSLDVKKAMADIMGPQPTESASARLRKVTTELEALSASTIAEIKAAKELGATNEELRDDYDLSADAVHVLNGYLAEKEKKTREAAKADEDATKKLRDFNTELHAGVLIGQTRSGVMEFLSRTAKDVGVAIDLTIPKFHTLGVAVSSDARAATTLLNSLKGGLSDVTGSVEGYNRRLIEGLPKVLQWRDSLRELSAQFVQLAQVSKGGLSGVVGEIGKGLNAIGLMDSGIRTLQGAFASMTSAGKMSFSGLMSAGTGILGLFSAIVSMIPGQSPEVTLQEGLIKQIGIFGGTVDNKFLYELFGKSGNTFGKGAGKVTQANTYFQALLETLMPNPSEFAKLYVRLIQGGVNPGLVSGRMARNPNEGGWYDEEKTLEYFRGLLAQHGLPSARFGGLGDFGAGTLAQLHGREAMVPLDRLGEFMTAAEKAAVGGRRGGDVHVNVDARGAMFRDRSMIRELADEVGRAMSDRLHQLYPVAAR